MGHRERPPNGLAMKTKLLQLSYPHASWTAHVLTDDLAMMNGIVTAAQRAVDAGGEFVLKGDPEIPTEDHRFDAAAFKEWMAQENEARVSLGKTALAVSM